MRSLQAVRACLIVVGIVVLTSQTFAADSTSVLSAASRRPIRNQGPGAYGACWASHASRCLYHLRQRPLPILAKSSRSFSISCVSACRRAAVTPSRSSTRAAGPTIFDNPCASCSTSLVSPRTSHKAPRTRQRASL